MRMSGQSVKDRTAEFQAVVDRLKKTQGAAPSTSQPWQTASPLPSASQFATKAQTMSSAIAQVATRIQKLTQLAKQTSVFEDNTAEINQLTGLVKRDLQGLNEELQLLQQASSRQGGSVQSVNHSTRVVDQLRGKLKDTTDSFKSVLEVRKDALQATQDRRHLFSSAAANGNQFQQTSFFMAEDSASNVAETSGSSQQQLMAPQADAYIQSRDVALQQINATIQELGGIFSQVAQMVAEQGEVALRIDENVDNVATNVNAAQEQLLKYLNTVSSNRWLLLKVFGIVLVFLLLFIMIS